MGFMAVAAFVPLPLHATAWLGAFGNVGRAQAFGVRPFLVGRFAPLSCMPWRLCLGLCSLWESAWRRSSLSWKSRLCSRLLPGAVLVWVTLRRAIGAIAAAGLAVAVLTSGDMTVTDLLQVRTYAEEAFLQYTLGRGPGEAAFVTLPPCSCWAS